MMNSMKEKERIPAEATAKATAVSTTTTAPPLPSSSTPIRTTTEKRERSYSVSTSRKRFADCALIEIIHLHDCLRGSLVEIENEVQILVDSSAFIGINSQTNNSNNSNSSASSTTVTTASSSTEAESKTTEFDIEHAADLSNSIGSRFHLIFSVFQAHSGAEDEFIWPALKMKIESKKSSNNNNSNNPNNVPPNSNDMNSPKCGCESMFEQEEYEEDHAIEENMFKQIHTTLRRLNGSFRYYHAHVTSNDSDAADNGAGALSSSSRSGTTSRKDSKVPFQPRATSSTGNRNSNTSTATSSSSTSSSSNPAIKTDKASCLTIIRNVIVQLKEQTDNLTQHLIAHLKKEETQCLPMVRRHMSTDEISSLVGKIMGQRSAEVMSKILNLAVISLPVDEREDMVSHMKKAMTGTFFETWLTTGGWLDSNGNSSGTTTSRRRRSSENSSSSSESSSNGGGDGSGGHGLEASSSSSSVNSLYKPPRIPGSPTSLDGRGGGGPSTTKKSKRSLDTNDDDEQIEPPR